MAVFTGTNATDILNGTTANDSMSGLGGDDIIFANVGRDTIRAGAGDDYVEGGAGNDNIRGDDGWDWLVGGKGFDTINGGTTAPLGALDGDTVSYHFEGGTFGVTVDLVAGTATDTFGNTDNLIDIERVVGSEFADTLTGGNIANDSGERFRGYEGNDTIDGGGGGTGWDIADYAYDYFNGGQMGIVADLSLGTVRDGFGDTDTLHNIDAIRGSVVSDDLRGDASRNVFAPLGGNDYIDGGDGFDALDYSPDAYIDDPDTGTGTRGIEANLAQGWVIDTAEYLDTVVNIEDLWGSYFGDVMRGDANSNEFHGGDGDDLLAGRTGDDFLFGELGHDHLKGGTDNDLIVGGQGDDDLRGGSGADTFGFEQNSDDDVLHRFVTGTDKIDVSHFGFATTGEVLAKLTKISADTALLQLSEDVSVLFDDINPSGTYLASGDILI
jgi:Ca2+-binding RTX toxin-like protein